MESFLFLVIAVVIFFFLLVVWAATRIVKLGGVEARVEHFEREMDRVHHRLTSLEAKTAMAATEPSSIEPQKVRAAAPSGIHVRPVRSASVNPVSRPAMVVSPVDIRPAAAPSVPTQIADGEVQPSMAAHMNAAPPPPPTLRHDSQTTKKATKATDASTMSATSRGTSLEERLGQNWLNKLGIVALVTGLALLLGYKLRDLGPVGKSVMGLVLAAAILVTGLLLERRNRYRTFARAMIGGGWALLFFVTFALYHLPVMQVLHSQVTDLVLMLAVASAMVLHSLRYRSQVVTSLAFLLGFFTVAISHVTVFSLVAGAVLATGLLAVAFRHRWFVLALGGLIAVYLNHALWLFRLLPYGASPFHSFAEFLPSAGLLLFYWLIFRLFYIFRVPENDGDRICSTLNALLNSAGLLTLLKYQSSHPEWAFWGLLALGLAELLLAFLSRRRHHRGFVALVCISSLCLLAAVPFRFTGANWSLLWLLESEMLFVAGLALRETVFRRLGVISAFASIVHLLALEALPVFALRQSAPGSGHHPFVAATLACAALAAWFNAEYTARRWPQLIVDALDLTALRFLSYAATLCAGLAVWLVLSGPWTLLPWLTIALILAVMSSRLRSQDLAQQADLLNLAVVARAALINFAKWDSFSSSPRVLILAIAAGILYMNMRRRQPAHVPTQREIEPVYAWAAAGVLSTLAWYALQPAAVAIGWSLLGILCVELGLEKRKPYFRHQAFALLAASFVRMFFVNIALAPAPRMATMLPMAAMFAWVYQRVYAGKEPDSFDKNAGVLNAWFALGTTVTLLYFSVRPAWVAAGGAALVMLLLLLTQLLRRPLFTVQAMTLILVTAARTLAFNVLPPEPLGANLTESRIFTAGLPCVLLFAAMPLAFSIRRRESASQGREVGWKAALQHPEQLLFFAPLAVLFAMVPVQFHGGEITVAWSVLGLLTFLFALTVGERSFRLAGLGMLLVGVGKIVSVDIWYASPTERYVTLIVMGAALLFVSFLYSRYRETILELL